MKKREFLKNITMAGLSIPFASFAFGDKTQQGKFNINSSGSGEDYWETIRQQYQLQSDYINLENGYYSMMAMPVLSAYIEHVNKINREASFYMRTRMLTDKLEVRQLLAIFLDCPHEELIITRNTTESMDTIICGIDWKSGDEAIMAQQDYGSMLDMFKQQARRYGIKNNVLSIPNHPKSDEDIVDLYRTAITPKTKLIMICHMINITGQILPVKKICDMAHEHGVKVLVDGAHAIAHLDFKIRDLNCDYYASSLHKWLGMPLGAGLLYVKKEHISGLWPLFGDSSYADDDIRKLNHAGTQPMFTELCMRNAIDFHQGIGSKRKEERLRFLQTYWTAQVRHIPGITINTPETPARACGIANVGIDKLKPADMAKTLMDKYRIWAVAIDNANVKGCRITPHVYTTTKELDTLVRALKEMNI